MAEQEGPGRWVSVSLTTGELPTTLMLVCLNGFEGSALTEGCGHANDKAFAGGELLGEVDLITGGTFDEVDVRDGITDFDHVGD